MVPAETDHLFTAAYGTSRLRESAMPKQTQNARPTDAPRTRSLTIVAQDPSIRRNGRILTARVDVPAEELVAGPWGHRVQIIDYDASTATLYTSLPPKAHGLVGNKYKDPFLNADDAVILGDPHFHAQNVYAIVMRTLARFEYALGRRVSWGFGQHQLKVAPHAFADANAFYSESDEALAFGYFPGADGQMVFSCLSHDVVVHETSHALLDGLRERFTDPSSPDQAAFHEGFSDVVAILSVFSLRDVIRKLVDIDTTHARGGEYQLREKETLVHKERLRPERLKDSIIFGMAKQMGGEMSGLRGHPLRQSLSLPVSPKWYRDSEEFLEPHRRGEIFVAAVLNAFVQIWSQRTIALGFVQGQFRDRERVVEEGATAADRLLTMVIRALDYTPPIHIEFGDFLSALLTADFEIQPDDTKYAFRKGLLDSFAAFGIVPGSKGTAAAEPGIWDSCSSTRFATNRTHFESMLQDPDEVFWFIWENRKNLGVVEGAFGKILSVRPCLRIASDGFSLRETVAEFYQVVRLTAAELPRLGLSAPPGMPRDEVIPIYGGNTVIFDEYGQPKYNIHNSMRRPERQQRRLNYLWEHGQIGRRRTGKFSEMHMQKGMGAGIDHNRAESW